MDATKPPTTDPAALVRSLDPEAISARLDEIERERQALLILHRAALAARKRQESRRKEAAHA